MNRDENALVTRAPPPVHYGKIRGTRRTFNKGANISSFVADLDFFVQFARGIGNYKP